MSEPLASVAPVEKRQWLLQSLSHGIFVAATTVGVGLSAYAGWRDYQSSLQLERAQFNSHVESSAAELRDHLKERETLTRAVGAVFSSADPLTDTLNSVDQRLLGFVPDAYSFVWAPVVEKVDAASAIAALRAAGVSDPRVLGAQGKPLRLEEYTDPLILVLDILPKTPQNMTSLGLNLASLPQSKAALQVAAKSKNVAATAPLHLIQLPEVPALVIYNPIFDPSDRTYTPKGYIGFSYRLDTLIGPVVSTNYPVRIIDVEADPENRLIFAKGIWSDTASVVREVSFGDRRWHFEVQKPGGFGSDSMQRGAITAAIALGLVAIVLAAVGYLLHLTQRLQSAESRLQVVNHELIHRIKNLFSVAQSIASQTFKDVDPDGEARKAYAGRMASLTRGIALLSEGEWQGTDLSDLIKTLSLPMTDRVKRHGAAVFIGPSTAQSFALLLHELWTNACKHGSLSKKAGMSPSPGR
jgi:two-component sensor histidine kinase